jgi:hypothetical protein
MSDYGKGGGESATEAAFYHLIGRAIVDADFRAQLQRGSVDDALTSIGIEPTTEIKEALSAAMANVDNIAKQFGGVKAAT